MTGQIGLGLCAGLTSALLYCAIITGSPLAMALFYLAPLPVLLVGLGWGWVSAGLGALVGALAAALVVHGEAAVFYAATCGAPSAWLTRLAMLSRPGPEGGPVEWYPPGRLVAQTAILGCVLAVATMVMIGPDAETYRTNIRVVIEDIFAAEPQLGNDLTGGRGAGEVAAYVAQLLLPATVTVWMITMLANLWLAARVLHASKRLARPWPSLMTVDLPRHYAAVFAACAVVMLIVPGAIGIVASAATSAWAVAYLLIGLAVLHAATLGIAGRTMLLAALYFALLVFLFAGVVVTIIGVAEPYLKIRARALAHRPPPGPD